MNAEKEIPVFIINGFLEAGKTSFIKDAIIGDPKLKKERIVIISCEEGVEEYDGLPKNVTIHTVEDEEDLHEDLFFEVAALYDPTYVLIEYNIIWGMDKLYDTAMPDGWVLVDQMTIIDAVTFDTYFNNMKSFFADMLRSSSMVIVKRCEIDEDFKYFRDKIRPCALQAEILYMNDEEGIMDITLEDELPYSLESDVIELHSDTYVAWYIDMMDNIERYIGKTVEFTALVGKPEYFRPEYFMAGNMVMTCCEDDMQFFGYVCHYDKTPELEEGSYIRLRAQIDCDFTPEYEEEGPVLYAESVTVLPKEEK